MYIVPIVAAPAKLPTLRQFWLFLERNGNHLIELDPSTTVQEFLEANDLTAGGSPIVLHGGGLVIVPIDPAACDLHTFYSWKEVAPGMTPSKEVWRPFFWALDGSSPTSDPWGVNQLLQEIELAEPNHTAFSVLSAYLATTA